ncbi:MAG: hypothetical protein WAW06_09935 [bacterium]
MRFALRLVALVLPVQLATASALLAAGCPYAVEKVTRVTHSMGASQTARGNERCICVDSAGAAHLTWEDDKDGNFEIYYGSIKGETVSEPLRLTKSKEDSNFPCIVYDGQSTCILWQETMPGALKTTQVFYVRLVGGKEVARKQITTAPLGACCPVAVVGPDKALNIAWHQGTGKITSVHYGRIVGDSLVGKTDLCTKHPNAFRPDIACDARGRILVAWYEGAQVKSRLCEGGAWQDELLVATNHSQGWRLSAANLGDNQWALTWFDQAPATTDVLASFFDGKAWHDQVRVNTGQTGFYPSCASTGPGRLMVAWEDQRKPTDGADAMDYLLLMRCYDGRTWGEPAEISGGRAMSRYASLAAEEDLVHAIWFSLASGDKEIYRGLLRRQ